MVNIRDIIAIVSDFVKLLKKIKKFQKKKLKIYHFVEFLDFLGEASVIFHDRVYEIFINKPSEGI